MKMTLTMQLSHWDGANEAQTKLFSRNTAMTVDLPFDPGDFERSFLDISQDAVPRMASQLFKKIARDVQKQAEYERANPTTQTMFPFMQDEQHVTPPTEAPKS